MTDDQADWVLTRYAHHLEAGLYTRAAWAWDGVFAAALDLCGRDSQRLGTRSLDVLHVATALVLGADVFCTLDERQARLATAAGLHAEGAAELAR